VIFCILDTETTGLKPDYHEVIQVAAIVCNEQLQEINKVSFKIKPQHIERANKKALEINGYNPRTWNPKFYNHKKAMVYLSKFIVNNNPEGDSVVMTGQNIKFDYNFLCNEYEQSGVEFPFSSVTLDLMDIAKLWSSIKNVKLRRYSLKYLAEFTKQVNTNPHDAEADAEVTLDVLKWFVKDLKRMNKHDRRRICKQTPLKI
jgi:DNA polymerase III alpha subunit (gram-positive type)